jgi:uncharacterized repeat protein (TIGR01451 family)
MDKIGGTQKRRTVYLIAVFIIVFATLSPAITPVYAVVDLDTEAYFYRFSQVFSSWLPPLGPLGAPRERPLFQEADHFVFDTITSPQEAGQAFAVTITAKDIDDNTLTDYSGTASLTDTTGTISPTTADSFSSGVWTGDVTISQARSEVTIDAVDGAATGTSESFDVDPGALDHFVFDAIASPQTAGQLFAVTITAKDAFGNTVTSYPGPASLMDTTTTIDPTTTGAFNRGVWTGDVEIAAIQNGVTITAADGAATGTSNPFDVHPGGLDHLVFAVIPSPQTAGQLFAVTITAKDASGNTVTGYTGSANLSEPTGTIDPSTTGSFSSGVWTGDVTITKAQGGITITATDGAASGQSNSFDMNAAAVDKIVIENADGGNADPVTTHTMTADQSLQVWAAGYDAYDNYVSVSVTWSGTGVVENQLDPVSGPTTTFTAKQEGDGTIHAVDGSGHTDDTGTITVNAGALDHIVIRDAASNGGSAVGARAMNIYETLDVWAAGYDADDNYTEDLTVNWSLAGDLVSGEIDPASGTSATFTPPATKGTGTIAATHSSSGLVGNTGLLTIQAPELVIKKTGVPSPVAAGQSLAYTIVYTNVGDAVAQALRVTDTYDSKVSYKSASPAPTNPPPGDANVWTQDTLAPDTSAEIAVTVNVTASVDPGDSIVNNVAISASRLDETTASVTTIITGTPELTMTLESIPDPVTAGDVLTYHVKYKNSGTARVTSAYVSLHYDGSIKFESSDPEPYPSTDHIWSLGTVNAGQEGTIDVRVTVDDFVKDQKSLATYGVIWKQGDSTGFTVVENTIVDAPALELVKSAAPDPAVADAELVYTLVYSNVGHAEAVGLVVTDAVPADTDFVRCEPSPCNHSSGIVTWEAGDLAADVGVTATLVVDVDGNVDNSTRLVNIARVHVKDTPDYSADARIETPLIASPSLELTISNGKDSVKAGEKLVYTLTYRNKGNAAADDVTIVATPPSNEIVTGVGCEPPSDCTLSGGKVNFDVGSVAAGGIGTVQMVATVKDPLPAGTRNITASAVINTSTQGEPSAGNSADDQDDIATRPNLVVRADYEDEMPWPGKRVTYSVRYNNTGHIATTGVVVNATKSPDTAFKSGSSDSCWVPQGGDRYRCVIGELDYNESGVLEFVVTLPSGSFTPEMTDFDATFTISDDGGSGADAFPDDNEFPALLGVPDLVIEKVISQPSVWAGGVGFLWAIVRNNGTGKACGVYNPDGCTPFAVDLFIDPETPPPSYPIEGYGDCFVFIGPIEPGLAQTAVISFTNKPAHLWPNGGSGFCAAQLFEEVYVKADNWDPAQPPMPAGYGLVPESKETNNVFRTDPGQDVYLPILVRD